MGSQRRDRNSPAWSTPKALSPLMENSDRHQNDKECVLKKHHCDTNCFLLHLIKCFQVVM